MNWRAGFSPRGALAPRAILSCLVALLPAAPPDRQLIWSDEFNGAPGSPPDPAKWVYDLGGNG